jgi:hypothetical protein
MRSQLAWPRVLRDIGIILFIAAALIAALEVGLLHGAELPSKAGPPAVTPCAVGLRAS